MPTSRSVRSTAGCLSINALSAALLIPYAASITAVEPSLSSLMFGSHPPSSNASIAFTAFSYAAWCKGAAPLSSLASRSAPKLASSAIDSASFLCAASVTAVYPPGTHACFARGSILDDVLASILASGIFARTSSAPAFLASNHHVFHSSRFCLVAPSSPAAASGGARIGRLEVNGMSSSGSPGADP